jgi:hypothetical protein
VFAQEYVDTPVLHVDSITAFTIDEGMLTGPVNINNAMTVRDNTVEFADLVIDNGNIQVDVTKSISFEDGTAITNDTIATENVTVSYVGSNVVRLFQAAPSSILSTDVSRNITALSTTTYPSLTELSYVKGATSLLQDQIDSKQATIVSGSTLSNTITSSSLKQLGTQTTSLNMGNNDILNAKGVNAASLTAASFVSISSATADTILATNSSKNIVSLDTATYPTLSELQRVKTVGNYYQANYATTINRNGSTAVYLGCSLTLPAGNYLIN